MANNSSCTGGIFKALYTSKNSTLSWYIMVNYPAAKFIIALPISKKDRPKMNGTSGSSSKYSTTKSNGKIKDLTCTSTSFTTP